MPVSKHNRARGRHKGGRVQWTGNKFLLTSAEAMIIQGQLGMLQQHLMVTYGSLHERIAKLEPQVDKPADLEAGATTDSPTEAIQGTGNPDIDAELMP